MRDSFSLLATAYDSGPESSDLEEDWDLDDNDSVSDCKYDHPGFGEQSERLKSDIVAHEDGAMNFVPNDAYITPIHRFISPDTVLPAFNSDNLDYCLIEIGESENSLPGLPVLSQENIGQPQSGSTNVLAATGSGNVLVGVLSSGLSCVRLPKAKKFMSVLTVKFEGSLQRGDSGSIVRDAKIGMIYRHIVAGDMGSQTALVIPATHVFNDIMARLRTLETTTTPSHEACKRHVLSETTGDGLEDTYPQAPWQCESCLAVSKPFHSTTRKR
ncbi:hypothetical protein N7507_003117 [Penicillium longicatenatum]|nr:hypothetical protein N7507_003117 [Penicillium longicatenatum]